MPALVSGDTRHHVLLPFTADACAISPLRGDAAVQLATWGLSALADDVMLAVSELATNVVCHVGSGAPAVLLLEVTGDRLRVEVHDTSRTLPTRRAAAEPTEPGETGRGLALVAALAGGWTATPTPGGKAVRCEFAVGNAYRVRFAPRIARAAAAVDGYRLSPTPAVAHSTAADTLAVSLLTDLLHWITANGSDPDNLLDHAQTCFETEVAEAREPAALPPARTTPGAGTARVR